MESMKRRPATPEEARALSHPLRMRILRLCLDQALTNKQLAEHLGRDPGTVLHHVRTLVATGFLVPEEVRQGEKGALEKPYRATGRSWTLRLDGDVATEANASLAILDEFVERPPDPDGEPLGLFFGIHRRTRIPPAQASGSGGVEPRS